MAIPAGTSSMWPPRPQDSRPKSSGTALSVTRWPADMCGNTRSAARRRPERSARALNGHRRCVGPRSSGDVRPLLSHHQSALWGTPDVCFGVFRRSPTSALGRTATFEITAVSRRWQNRLDGSAAALRQRSPKAAPGQFQPFIRRRTRRSERQHHPRYGTFAVAWSSAAPRLHATSVRGAWVLAGVMRSNSQPALADQAEEWTPAVAVLVNALWPD